MKRKIGIFLFLLAIITIIIFNYIGDYSIKNNDELIGASILSYINRPTKKYNDLEIKYTLDFDNKKYVLFTLDDTRRLGFSEFTRGYNNRYKYYSAQYGISSSFGGHVFETNKGKYIVIYGKNQNIENKLAIVNLDGKDYKMELPVNEHYITYTRVPMDTRTIFFEDYKLQ